MNNTGIVNLENPVEINLVRYTSQKALILSFMAFKTFISNNKKTNAICKPPENDGRLYQALYQGFKYGKQHNR